MDLLLEDDRCILSCKNSPIHFSVLIDKFNYTLPYDKIFGGVVGFKPQQFIKANGYSNRYLGWGAEDDDMYQRLKRACPRKIYICFLYLGLNDLQNWKFFDQISPTPDIL